MTAITTQGASAHDEASMLNGLDALLVTAARSSPETVLVADDAGSVTAKVLMHRVCVLAERLKMSGLGRGERILLVAGAQTQTLVVLIAALRAGLEPALVRPGLGAIELASLARVSEAAALVGPAFYGEAYGEVYLSAAALADGIRLIATHGAEPVDGALDVSAADLDASPEPAHDTMGEPQLEMPLIATFTGPMTSPRLVSHRQAALFSDALSLVEQARINPTRCILSLLPPASRASLVAGPFAALIGASQLVLHGPFSARTFLAHLDAEPGAHLVVPSSVGVDMATSALASGVSSMILVSRYEAAAAFELPTPLPTASLVVDLYAFGEDSVLAQRRLDGEARAPNRIPDRRLTDGLGARLNRARAEHRLHAGDDS